MATNAYIIKSRDWSKHLRPKNKKAFWSTLRHTYAKKIQEEASELQIMQTLEDELFQEV